MIQNKKGFTLVEIIVALTIFSVIMISVMSVYIVSSETTYNSEINRAMHENVKNIVVEISEDIVQNGIEGVSDSITGSCSFPDTTLQKNTFKSGFIFCTKEYIYTISKKDASGSFIISNNIDCDKMESECYLTRQSKIDSQKNPLSNSLVTIRNIDFRVTDNGNKKVTILLKIQPSVKAGVRLSLVEKNIFNFQTTITQRSYNKK